MSRGPITSFILPKFAEEFKSPWRIEQERRRAEERIAQRYKSRLVRPHKEPAARIPRDPKPPKPRGPRKDRVPLPLCVCGNRMLRASIECFHCAEFKRNQDRRTCAEPECGALLQRNNTLDKCLKHAQKLRNQRSNDKRKSVI